MPFSWYHPQTPIQQTNPGDKGRRMYLLELGERASLLRRLGYGKEAVVSRLRANLNWDFEISGAPKGLLDQVKAVVDGVFIRKGMAGGGPPAIDG